MTPTPEMNRPETISIIAVVSPWKLRPPECAQRRRAELYPNAGIDACGALLLARGKAPSGLTRVPADRAVVVRFVAHLMGQGHPGLKVDHWLEDEHPGQSVVEAIAGPFAIEHTSIDTLPHQRRIGQQFVDALGVLERLGEQIDETVQLEAAVARAARALKRASPQGGTR